MTLTSFVGPLVGVCITAESRVCRTGRDNDCCIGNSLLGNRGNIAGRATEAGMRGSLDGGIGGGASSTPGDGPRATIGRLPNTFFLRLPFGVAMTCTPWPKGFRTGFLDSVTIQYRSDPVERAYSLRELVPTLDTLCSTDSMNSLIAKPLLGFFRVAMAPLSSSSIIAFFFNLTSVACDTALKSTSR